MTCPSVELPAALWDHLNSLKKTDLVYYIVGKFTIGVWAVSPEMIIGLGSLEALSNLNSGFEKMFSAGNVKLQHNLKRLITNLYIFLPVRQMLLSMGREKITLYLGWSVI